jgi:hypothetical protein
MLVNVILARERDDERLRHAGERQTLEESSLS